MPLRRRWRFLSFFFVRADVFLLGGVAEPGALVDALDEPEFSLVSFVMMRSWMKQEAARAVRKRRARLGTWAVDVCCVEGRIVR